MESTSSCNSMIGYSLKWRCCSLVWPKSVRQNPVLTTPSEIESSLRLRGPILRSIARLPFSLVIVPSMVRYTQKNRTPSPRFHQLMSYADNFNFYTVRKVSDIPAGDRKINIFYRVCKMTNFHLGIFFPLCLAQSTLGYND
jgi:hypothetical protein